MQYIALHSEDAARSYGTVAFALVDRRSSVYQGLINALPGGGDLIQGIQLSQTGSRPDSRIPVFVLLSEDLQQTLVSLPRSLDPTEIESVFVIAPASVPAASPWPEQLRFQQVATDEILKQQGCLCCDLRSELAVFLGQLFMSLLARRQARVKAVLVLTQAREMTALRDALEHSSFLAQRYVLAGALRNTAGGLHPVVLDRSDEEPK